MATKVFCDKCGVEGAHRLVGELTPVDLCSSCRQQMREFTRAALEEWLGMKLLRSVDESGVVTEIGIARGPMVGASCWLAPKSTPASRIKEHCAKVGQEAGNRDIY
jgi:hypothetical protein